LFKDNGLRETGISDLSIEVLHSLLIQIQQYVSNESSNEQYEQLLNLLRKGRDNHFSHDFIG
jgi:hypothetical protein